MDDKDFRQAMKWYRRAPVTHVAPETGSLAAPQKKDIAHREKARVWFPRQTPADSALQQENVDEMLPEEKSEDTIQGAVTVYQEKKVAAYGRMEKVDAPEAMDAPDVPLADAMSADNPPCDVDFRAVPDSEVLQLGMDEEPVVAEEAPVADSPFENMIASVEAGLASMLAEGPPAADEGQVAGEDADDETAALLAGMSEEERAEIAGFDLSLLRDDAPGTAHAASPEEALTAGLSKEELAEIAGFDPALLADGQEAERQAETGAAVEKGEAETGAEAVFEAEPDGEAATAGKEQTAKAPLPGAGVENPSEAGLAGLSEETGETGEAVLPEVAAAGEETVQVEPETAVEAGEAETGAEAVFVPESGREMAAAEEADDAVTIDEPAAPADVPEAIQAAQDAIAQGEMPGEPVMPETDGSVAAASDGEKTGEAEEVLPAEKRMAEAVDPEEGAVLPDVQDASEFKDAAGGAENAVATAPAEDGTGAGLYIAAPAEGAVAEEMPAAEADVAPEQAEEAAEEKMAAVAAVDEDVAKDAAFTGVLETASAEEAFSEEVKAIPATGVFPEMTAKETDLPEEEPSTGVKEPVADEGIGEETALTAGADRTEQAPDLSGIRNEPEPDGAEAPVRNVVPDRTTEAAVLAGEDEPGQAETGQDALLHDMALDGVETLSEAEAVQAEQTIGKTKSEAETGEKAKEGATAEEGKAAAVPLPEIGTENPSEAGLAGFSMETGETGLPEAALIEEIFVQAGPEAAVEENMTATGAGAYAEAAVLADVPEAIQPVQASAIQEEMPDAPVRPEAGDSGAPASGQEEGLPVEAGATEADVPEEGAVLVDMQGASEPEEAAFETAPAGEVFSGEAETLPVTGIAPERVEEEPTADDAFASATASEEEATEVAVQAESGTVVEEDMTATGEEAASGSAPGGEAAAEEAAFIATKEEPVVEAAALADVLEAAQAGQDASVQEEMPGEPVMPEANSSAAAASDGEEAGKLEEAQLVEESTAEAVDPEEGAVLHDVQDAVEPEKSETAGEEKAADALLPETGTESPSEAGAASLSAETGKTGEAGLPEVVQEEETAAQAGPETAVEEGMTATGEEAISVPEPGGQAATGEAGMLAAREEPAAEAAELAEVSEVAQAEPEVAVEEDKPAEPDAAPAGQTGESDVGISSGAAVLPDPETALADGILLAEGEALPAAPVAAPDGVTAEPKGMIPEEEVFRDKMRNHQRNRMAFAEYKVAAAYAREGTEAACQEAIKWYTRAAEKGHAVSRFNLGNIYYAGRGVTQDYAKAADWYELAARQGVARAQDNLGLMFFHGRGRPVEPERAVYWFRQAAIQGYAPAQYKLAMHLEAGVGVEPNRAEALYWYRKAASQGDARAQKEAARLEEDAGR